MLCNGLDDCGAGANGNDESTALCASEWIDAIKVPTIIIFLKWWGIILHRIRIIMKAGHFRICVL